MRKLSKPLLLEIIKGGVEAAINELGIEVAWNIDNPRVNDWIKEELGNKIKGINDTTLEKLKGTLQDGIDLGEGVDDLAKRVRETFEDAKGIGRKHCENETISAFTEGNRSCTRSRSETITILGHKDERTCEECFSEHGRKYDIQESQGVIPKHVNCRCTWVAVMEE